jgi:hypothetical protein
MKLALLAVLLLAGCATAPEVTLIAGPRWIDEQPDVAVTIMLMQRYGKHGIGGCVHQSEPQHGPPFNGEDEQVFDSCGAGWRWGGK